ncbi:hypothetical protein J2S74_003983 [Evansella vedderi]|uniref:Uncharacterized protein n=1 Tax=Evansella vedderi TaxID=38282 RepID=A0ABT9ZZ91_9BACI|nr:hypothetical protein [Evansella vedderi]MDQ0256563.1 hypothetical protein [Evansella vedderi]
MSCNCNKPKGKYVPTQEHFGLGMMPHGQQPMSPGFAPSGYFGQPMQGLQAPQGHMGHPSPQGYPQMMGPGYGGFPGAAPGYPMPSSAGIPQYGTMGPGPSGIPHQGHLGQVPGGMPYQGEFGDVQQGAPSYQMPHHGAGIPAEEISQHGPSATQHTGTQHTGTQQQHDMMHGSMPQHGMFPGGTAFGTPHQQYPGSAPTPYGYMPVDDEDF